MRPASVQVHAWPCPDPLDRAWETKQREAPSLEALELDRGRLRTRSCMRGLHVAGVLAEATRELSSAALPCSPAFLVEPGGRIAWISLCVAGALFPQ